jgi:hypothetical protein
MNNNAITLQKIDGIYDITPIIKPASSLLETTLLSFFVILLISMILYITWQLIFSKKAISKRKIKELHNTYLNNKISKHDASYELCVILRAGLNIKNISEDTDIPKKLLENKKMWVTFSKNLTDLRYKDNKTTLDITPLFNESLFWLKVWP